MFLILTVPSFFIAYEVQPVPALLMSKQVLSELAAKIMLGIVTAVVYGKGHRATGVRLRARRNHQRSISR